MTARRIRRLIARSIVDRVDLIALQRRYLEVYPSELHYISYPHHLRLVVWEKVFQDLVDGAFLSDNQPHRPAQVHVVFFIFISLAFCLRLLIDCLDYACAVLIWYFIEMRLIEKRLVIGPEASILMFHNESKHNLILPLQS